MRLGLFLALVATSFALECNVGKLILEDGVIVNKNTVLRHCAGQCSRSVVTKPGHSIISLSCEEDEAVLSKNVAECSFSHLSDECLCSENQCSDVIAKENLRFSAVADVNTGLDAQGQLICYVGVYAAYNNYSVGVDVPCNGKCLTLSTTVSGNIVKAYQCVDPSICASVTNTTNGCTSLVTGDNDVTACCCDGQNNCNSFGDPVFQNPPVSNYTGTPIACWTGLYVNGLPITNPTWTGCMGDCAAIQMNTSLSGTPNLLTLYTCDPIAVCQGLRVVNQCRSIDALPGITGCCCSTDACMDPSSIIPKSQNLNCYAGIVSDYNNISVGATVKCQGRCASLTGIVAGSKVTAYQCIDTNVCKTLGADGTCQTIPNDREITGCCCGDSDYCNIKNTNIVAPTPPTYSEPVIACFSGMYVNNRPLTAVSYSACRGQCASISLNTTVNNLQHTATLYTCDPSSVCRQLNMTNSCASPEPGVQGCCCDSNACIDPTANRTPGNQLTCYVGVYAAYNNYSAGADTICSGKCASLETTFNGQKVKSFHCISKGLAESLGVDNGCQTIQTDREIKGCVCDNAPNCNVVNEPVLQNPIVNNFTGTPIACWNGLYVNGQAFGSAGWNGCNGYCAAIQLNTTMNSQSHSLVMYTCDPAAACSAMGLNNNCGTIDSLPGVTGCCCDSDGCMDSKSIVPKTGTTECFVGVVSNYNNGFQAVGRVTCNGQCASLSGVVGGFNVSTYQCVDRSVCTALGADNSCNSVPGDNEIKGCCCSDSDFCNIKGTNITPPPKSNVTEPTIACYTALWLNGGLVSKSKYQACSGLCSSITLKTQVVNLVHTATMYMCDPSSVCGQLNLTNACHTLTPNVTGCCCDSDSCIDPTKNRVPGRRLLCYVGVYAAYNNYSAGADTVCNGKCASLETTFNGGKVKSFHCVPNNIVESLHVDNGCTTVRTDRDITGCVCDDKNYCNIKGEPVAQNPIVKNFTGTPIACWSGLYVNGNAMGATGWNNCNGECAAIQYSTNPTGVTNNLILYTCDPAAACAAMGMNNKCGTMDNIPGLTGCCCDTDGCMDSTSIYPKTGSTKCFVGVVSEFNNLFAGASVNCAGRCSSLSGTIAGFKTTAYQCVDKSVCTALGLDGNTQCATVPGDNAITGCCCADSDFCSTKGTTIQPPPVKNATEPAIACYTGLYVNNQLASASKYVACQGHCASVGLATVVNGQNQSATVYMCDPSQVCSQLNLTNSCQYPAPGVQGCCCETDSCIDPTKNRYPGRQLLCYVGVYAAYNNYSAGSDTICNGKCASLETKFNGQKVKSFHCIPDNIVEGLSLDNGCQPVYKDADITGCVCDNKNYCNVNGEPVAQNPIVQNFTGIPIACWSGIYVNGKALSGTGWNSCNGECAVIQYSTNFTGVSNTLTLYTCDPAAACAAMGMNNKCGTMDNIPGLTGCCCDTDGCMDSTSIVPKTGTTKCFVGVVSTYNSMIAGASVNCAGRCSSLSGTVSGYNVTAYQCVDKSVCTSLGLDGNNQCATVPGDNSITGCCCADSDFCSIKGTTVNPPPVRNVTEPTIACYTGLYVNGAALAPSKYVACQGECASLSMNTMFNGVNQSATIYMCDPSSLCGQLNMTNNCQTIEPNVSGCCCNSDTCIDPTKNRYPGKQLTCYVGVYAAYNNASAGADTICNGKCASLETMINNNRVKSFHCITTQQAESFGVDNDCRSVQTDREIKGCVCDNANNCNVKFNDPVLQSPIVNNFTGTPIACWNGLYVNGQLIGSEGWNGCSGYCAAVQLNTTVNSQSHSLTLYTCDPAAACSAMQLNNNCGIFDALPGVTGCCCDSDGCMDSKSIVPKTGTTECFVGVVSNYNNGFQAVGRVTCNGQCASLSGVVGGYNVSTYQCVDKSVCTFLGADNTCNSVPGDNEINGCCCSDSDFCNIKGTNITPPPKSNVTEPTIACYTGLWLNGGLVSKSKYQACSGLCSSITLKTQVVNLVHTATMYMCDPSSVCGQLNLTNACHTLTPNVTGCCCDSDSCIDPTKNRYPGRQLLCYVGLYAAYNNYSAGADTVCNGKCASLETTFNGGKVKSFHCVPNNIVESLHVDNGCTTVRTDRDITGCVCDDKNYCNVKGEPVAQNPIVKNFTGIPIACWSGLYVNGNAQGGTGWNSCNGECAAIQYSTSLSGVTNNLTLYTCDPAAACAAMGMNNKCGTMDNIPGLVGCCCDTDGCMDSTSIIPKTGTTKCFVGVVSEFNNLFAGASVNCAGRCSSLSGTIAGFKTTAYQCVDKSVCTALGLDGTTKCATVPGDNAITGCCCADSDFCSTKGTTIQPPPVKNATEPAIACYTGLYVNNQLASASKYVACQGHCASVGLATVVNGQNQSATVYMCDPSQVCSQLNLTNSCQYPAPGVQGCCCETDSCIDPTKNRYPGRQLLCYVGVYAAYNNYSAGSDTICNGKCASLETKFNGQKVKSFHCIPDNIVEGLSLDNGCQPVYKDADITGCVCDNKNYCNVNGEPVAQNPIVQNFTGIPVVCWSGIYVNGKALSGTGWNSCNGECAAIQYSTNLTGVTNNLTLYTCDPAAACAAMRLNNKCGTVDMIPGLTGCCCDTDGCMDSTSIIPKTGTTKCFVGVVSEFNNLFAGASVNCAGRCSSLSGTIAGFKTTAYQCVDKSVCTALGLDGTTKCATVPGDNAITGCCCADSDFCSTKGTTIQPPPVKNATEPAIACYTGLYVNNQLASASKYVACQGHCASVGLATVVNGQNQSATVYMCDPSQVCSQLNLTNSCQYPAPGVQGCCCETDSCIDPTKNRYPGRQLLCYVGVYAAYNNYSAGSDTICNGKCASLETKFNGQKVKSFHCIPDNIVEGLSLDNGCQPVYKDADITGCVCDNKNYCNVNGEPVAQNPIVQNFTGIPVVCWSGIYVNGKALSGTGWNSCNGECAAIQYSTNLTGVTNNLTLYTCDPAAACAAMGLNNKCGTVDMIPGLTGCCCDTDGCMDSTSIIPKTGTTKCFVGVVSEFNNLFAGASVNCAGRCSSLSGTIARFKTTAYQCVDKSVCTALGLDGTTKCATVPGDNAITGCCCADSDFCSTKGTTIQPPPVKNATEPAIACYTGLYVNNQLASASKYVACQGHCASVGLATVVNGQNQSATVYMCDPSQVCSQLNLTNSCQYPAPGVQGCCCETDSCIDPTKNRYPGRQLLCYVGVYAAYNNYSAGSDTICNGKCASLETKFNGQKVKSFHCIPDNIVEGLSLDNGCQPVYKDADITGCVCDNKNYCNVNGEPVAQNPIVQNFTGIPVVCWSGIYVNGKALSGTGWNSCNGECAAIQYSTNLTGVTNNLTLYTCDPAAACAAMGLNNKCGTVDMIPGLTGCCCDSDACMDSTSIIPKTGTTKCFVGVVSTFNSLIAGASVNCAGRCSSLSGTVSGYNVTAYQCVDKSVCSALGLDGNTKCATVPGDNSITGCCCADSDFCSTQGTTIQPPDVKNVTEPAIACYTGLWINGALASTSKYVACQGQCASVSIATTFQKINQNATIYMCDPSSVCGQLNLTNTCTSPSPGVTGCCCETDTCIDPTRNRLPGKQVMCYIGAYSPYQNYSRGADALCNGKCASLETYVNNQRVKLFQCITNAQAEALHIDNDCRSVMTDREVTACVCDKSNNCNVKPNDPVLQNPVNATFDGKPIACWSALYVNGQPQADPALISCKGNCAAVQLNTTVQGGQSHSLTLYTCDPVAVCNSMNLNNNCGTIDGLKGVTGCCCDSNTCTGLDSIYPAAPQGGLASGVSTMIVAIFAAVYLLWQH